MSVDDARRWGTRLADICARGGLGGLVLACTSLAHAQDAGSTTAEVAQNAEAPWTEAVGAVDTPEALCKRAAQAYWEMTGVIHCEWAPVAGAEFHTFQIVSGGNVQMYLARREAERTLRIVALLEDVMAGPTEGASTKVLRIFTPPGLTKHDVFVVETEVGFINWENSEVDGYDRRQLTVCLRAPVPSSEPPRCTLQVPLSFERWYGRTAQEDGFAATDGYRVKHRARATATAMVRDDGQVRLTRKTGSWVLLHGGSYFGASESEFPRKKALFRSYEPKSPAAAESEGVKP